MNQGVAVRAGRILIVDDETVVRDSLAKWFSNEGYQIKSYANANETLAAVRPGEWDVALLDIKMPGMDGMELQRHLKEIDPDLIVIVMTGYASVETAVQALKAGAYDYITKPFDPDDLLNTVSHAIEHHRAQREVVRLQEQLRDVSPKAELIGESPAMRRVWEMIEVVAPSDSTVLITGESGTGKEVVARAIHAASPRRNMPLVAIHCGALSESLLESELFGHERGAFTGAQARRKGKFEVAEGGTVFLDEIGDISLKTQTDLLRVLQEKEITRVGGTQPIKLDFRCITATNRNLEAMVKEGAFRLDLYYRLNVVQIHLPALRERREDIPLLAIHFAEKYGAAMNRPAPRISEEAMRVLAGYQWPGNVRELENAIERAMVMNSGATIEAGNLPIAVASPAASAEGERLEDIERKYIIKILEETGGNLSRAARILDIDRTTLYGKLKHYGLKRQSAADE
ncbi:MAG TPA: sigma-54 dependent transcriptional regulator [Candidatus Acidoferrum sp.]|nr:sigma-54 dependent transcriptional regulator [Candidatus Acidoferrum sp.]